MDFVKSAVSFITLQRFTRFLLKRILGGILNTDISLEQLDVQLYNGVLQLTDAVLNVNRINHELKRRKLPIHLISGHLSRVRVQIPWTKLLSDPCKIFVNHILLRVDHVSANVSGSQTDSDTTSSDSSTKPTKTPSSSNMALIELVRQVLLNMEGYVDQVTIELEDASRVVFETNNLVMYSDSTGRKKIAIGKSSIRLAQRREEIVSVSPVQAEIDFSDTTNVELGIKLSSVSMSVPRRRTITCLCELYKRLRGDDKLAESVVGLMFESVMEDKDEEVRPWYEEIYQIIEDEVIRNSAEMDAEDVVLDEIPVHTTHSEEPLDVMTIGQVQLQIDEMKISLLGVEDTAPGMCFLIKEVSMSKILNKTNIEVSDYGVYLNPVSTNSDMFVSMMSSSDESDSASSVYESVVDSEDSIGLSAAEDDDLETSVAGSTCIYPVSESLLEWEAMFFESGGAEQVVARQKVGFTFETNINGHIIVHPSREQGKAIRILIEGLHHVFVHDILVQLSPVDIANLALISQQVSEHMIMKAFPANSVGTSSPLSVECPGLMLDIALGNGHNLILKTEGPFVYDSALNQGIIPGVRIYSGTESAARLGSISIKFLRNLLASADRSDPTMESPSSPWTAVGGQPVSRRTLKAAEKAEDSKPLDSSNARQIQIRAEELAFSDSALTFLDLQLKVMSLIDQVAMANVSLGLGRPQEAVSPNPSFFISLFVKETLIRDICLDSSNLTLAVGGSGPVVTIQSQECRVGSLINTFPAKRERSLPPMCLDLRVDIRPPPVGGSLSRIDVTVCIGNLHIRFDPSLLKEYDSLVQFLIPPVDLAPMHAAPLITAPPRPTVTVVTVCVSESFVSDLNGAVVTLDNVETSSGITSTVDKETPVGVSFKAEKVSLHLARSTTTDWNFSAEVDWLTNLRLRGYVSVTQWQKGQGFIEWNLNGTHFALDISGGSLRFDLKPDTYDGLTVFISKMLEDFKSKSDTEQGPSPQVTMEMPPFTQPVAAVSGRRNFQIREDFVQARTSGRGGSRFATNRTPTAAQPMEDRVGARWLVDPNSVTLVHDHLSNRDKGREGNRKEIEMHVKETGGGGIQIVSVGLDSVRMFLVEGNDWEGSDYYLSGMVGKKSSPNNNPNSIGIELEQVSLELARACQDSWANASITVGDVRIKDGVAGSVYQHVVCQWGTRLGTNTFISTVQRRSEGESKGQVSIAPLSITVDQDTLEFITSFVDRAIFLQARRCGSSREVEIDLVDNEGDDNLPNSDVVEPPVEDMQQRQERLFKAFSISPIQIELNYKSKRISLSKLRKGDSLQLLNLVPLLEGLRVSLGEVKMVDVGDPDDFRNRLITAWAKDINKAQLFKSIASMTPLRSFANLSCSITDLIRQPLRQYKRKDGRISRGVLRGVTSFVRTLTIESLNLADVVVSSAQTALELVDATVGHSSDQSTAERLDCIVEDDEDDEGNWVPVERGARERALDPASAIEGLRAGSDSLIRGVTVTRAKGAQGFILQPAIGAAEAVSVVIRGARSAVDSGKHHAETERKYKGPYVQGDLLKGT